MAKVKKTTRKARRQDPVDRPEQPARKRRSLLRRVVAGTTKGTGRVIAQGTRAGVGAVRNRGAKQRFPEGYMPEPGEVAPKAWYPGGGGKCACGKRFGSDVDLRRHYEVWHNGEEPVETNIERYHGADALRFERNKNARTVKTVRRKKPATSPSAGRATTAGGRTMGRRGPNVEIEALQLLRRGFEEIGLMGTGGLSKMRAFADGLDIVFGRDAAQAFEGYRLSLLHKEFPPEVLTGLITIEGLMEEVARESTKWIEHLERVLEKDIEAARRLRKSGPAVDVLAG